MPEEQDPGSVRPLQLEDPAWQSCGELRLAGEEDAKKPACHSHVLKTQGRKSNLHDKAHRKEPTKAASGDAEARLRASQNNLYFWTGKEEASEKLRGLPWGRPPSEWQSSQANPGPFDCMPG